MKGKGGQRNLQGKGRGLLSKSTRAMENDNEVACSLLPNMCKALVQARWS